MQEKHSKQAVAVEYTTKPVSGWGGLVSIGRYFEGLGVREFLRQALPDGRRSNNQVPVVDMAMQFIVTVLTGGSRFEHVERVREDEVVKQVVQARRFGSASSLTRYLGNFLPSQSEHMHVTLSSLIFKLLGGVANSDVLDLDSTVFQRYGKQEGSSKGYNPVRKGARSHHPLLAMLAKSKVIAHAWLRAGNASPHRGACEFMVELLSRLPKSFQIIAVRADSGFYSKGFMAMLEEHKLPYVIAAKMSQPFARWCAALSGWEQVDRDIEITEADYKSPRWRAPRRVIVVRKVIRRTSKDRLFEVVDYKIQAFVTSKTDPPLEVWRFYFGRGDCENRIKELKNDFNAAGFCLQSFHGTEAAFRLICFTFNLVAIFKATVLKDRTLTLDTIRSKIFVVGGIAGSSGRRRILRLGLIGRWRREFSLLLQRVTAATRSTAAQLGELLETDHLHSPSPWRLRHNPMLKLLSY